MTTRHRFIAADARDLGCLSAGTVHCVVTSPPYPMIEMWDACFTHMNGAVADALATGDGTTAFELMHLELDRVWRELERVLIDGGIVCLNIGDATRSIAGTFQLYANHARILSAFRWLGFQVLPTVLWRKQTNAPNKFMGSGMLPPGAYVTLEHETILILRKGAKRPFDTDTAKALRRESAFFWEERNYWFSDVWFNIKGTPQELGDLPARGRSAAFPFEIAHRLVNMFSVKQDTILDPFAGTGTTNVAAAAAERHSIGVDSDSTLLEFAESRFVTSKSLVNDRNRHRLEDHLEFVRERLRSGKRLKFRNQPHDVLCVSAQETDLRIRLLADLTEESGTFVASYSDMPALQKDLPGFEKLIVIPFSIPHRLP